MKSIKYIPKFIVPLIFLLLLVIAVMLFFGRTKPYLRVGFLQANFTDFYQHISNFSISYLLVSGIGFMWLMLGVKFRFILLLAGAILLGNLIYELWIPVLNTPDVIDAIYGMVGTLVATFFLYIVSKHGLKINPANAEDSKK
jgi:hypothetical protein